MVKCTSEFVSLGHPDKMADFISSYLLDRYLEKDPTTRFAVECQIKDNLVNLAGEVSSFYEMSFDEITEHVKAAVRAIGYTRDYLARWGNSNTCCAELLRVNSWISQQSPDIAHGVDFGGWGDQGIFWGMATEDESTFFMPYDHFYAAKLGRHLYEHVNAIGCGLDIKTQVETFGGRITKVIVAAPALDEPTTETVAGIARHFANGAPVIVNGTGVYKVHGPVGDCGTTGRKLAVDFYGGNCRIGGGSPWTKDATKADVTLNLYARKVALDLQKELGGEIHVAISSCIGRPEISLTAFTERMCQIKTWEESFDPGDLITQLKLREPNFAKRCREGLFFDIV